MRQDGKEVEDRTLGEIEFRGTGSMNGYCGEHHPGRTNPNEEGWIRTGDMGYIVDEQLYVLGRRSSRVAVSRRRTIFPEDVELVVQTVDGVRYGAVVALSSKDGLSICYETQDGLDGDEMNRVIARRLKKHFDAEFTLVRLSPRSIPRSPSGKIRRHLCQQFFERGILDRNKRREQKLSLTGAVQQARNAFNAFRSKLSKK